MFHLHAITNLEYFTKVANLTYPGHFLLALPSPLLATPVAHRKCATFSVYEASGIL